MFVSILVFSCIKCASHHHIFPSFFQYAICKRKLESKCEALLILSGDLDQCRQERDQFKLMAEQVQQRYQALKRQLAGVVILALYFNLGASFADLAGNLAFFPKYKDFSRPRFFLSVFNHPKCIQFYHFDHFSKNEYKVAYSWTTKSSLERRM